MKRMVIILDQRMGPHCHRHCPHCQGLTCYETWRYEP